MDTIEIEILDDGTIKASIAGKVGPGNHRNADEALRLLAQLMGGPVEVERTRVTHTHQRTRRQIKQGG